MVNCPYCGKKVGENERYCLHCENDLSEIRDKEQKPRCFIASTVYGEKAYETMLLRKFRDEKLKNNFFGTIFIDLYYLISPKIAKLISKNNMLKKLTKTMLKPIIMIIKNKKQ